MGLTLHSINSTHAAEEEFTLLTITGDLIGDIETLDENSDPETIISSYYELLNQESREELQSLRQTMDRRVEDYQVAYTAADTAEINETLDDLSLYWATIRTIHSDKFTDSVNETLQAAYGEIYSFIAAPVIE